MFKQNKQQGDIIKMQKIRALIGPSILASDFANLQSQCQSVLDMGVDFLHIDIMDGHFVNNLTFGPPVVQSLRKKLPNAYFDCHLMVTHPQNYIESLAKAKVDGFTFHYEACADLRPLCQKIKQHKMEVGVSLKPKTQLSPYLIDLIKQGLVQKVLVMTVQPGFGGQQFLSEVLPKVQQLRQLVPDIDIQVDGGITQQTIKIAAQNGANVFVAGSAVFGQKDRKSAVEKLKQIANEQVQKKISKN